MRSKFVLVCHPWPVNPFPPCSAGTDGSAPASALGKTGYVVFVEGNVAWSGRFRRSARTACRWGSGASAARGRKQKCAQNADRRAVQSSHMNLQRNSIRIIACNGAGVAPETGGLFDDLKRYIGSHGIQIKTKQMDVDKPGEFDGPSLTLNPVHDREALCFYLAHSFGSIYQWSTDCQGAQKVFDGLQGREKGARQPTPFRKGSRGMARVRADLLRSRRLGAR